MKPKTRVISLSLVATLAGLASCATVSKVGQNSTAFMQATIDKVHPAQIKVVEVREKDLKEQLTGQEQALAYEKTRKRSFWSFGGPVDFQETSLPEPGGDMENSLLPPKAP